MKSRHGKGLPVRLLGYFLPSGLPRPIGEYEAL